MTTHEELAARVHAGMPRAKDELTTLVAMRSIADERQEPPEECRNAAEWVRDAFAAEGITDIDLYPTSDGTSAVIGHRPGPAGAPTILLYSHYDVQPPGELSLWKSDPWTMTDRGGRWYGRGAADCKGNIIAHLLALRALGEIPVGLRIVIEGSEEMGTGGLENLVRDRPELFAADVIVIADVGNLADGVPTATTTLRGIANVVVRLDTAQTDLHSGQFGGPAPDALASLVKLLASLRDDAGNTIIDGLDCQQIWKGADYPEERFRADAGVLPGVELLGTGTVADRVWARPAVTILAIDAPPVVGAAAAIQPHAAAALNLRVPPGVDPVAAQDALVAHLDAHTPWGTRVTIERGAVGSPFHARTDGPAFAALSAAMTEAFGADLQYAGEGGSIPLCNALAEAHPEAELLLVGVEEPGCKIHAPNESVDPAEIERIAVTEALLLGKLAGTRAS